MKLFSIARTLAMSSMLCAVVVSAAPRANVATRIGETYLLDMQRGVLTLVSIARTPAAGGLRLSGVDADPIGSAMGLREGDVLSRVNGTVITSTAQLTEVLGASPPASTLQLEIKRDKKPLLLLYAADLTTLNAASADAVSVKNPTDTKRLDEDNYEIERATFDGLLANPTELAKTARLVPAVKDGKPSGYKLYAIRPGSIFARFGLQNGDRIAAVNDRPIDSPDDALALYTELRSTTLLRLSIERRGQSKILTLRIR